MKIWDATTGEPLQTLRGHAGLISGLAFSRDGRRLASSGGEDKTVKIWDPLTGREILNLRGHTDMCTCVAFSPDGRRLVSASSDRTIRIWDASPLDGERGAGIPDLRHDDEVWSVAFSPDGGSLASASWDKTVRLLGRTDRRAAAHLRSYPGSVFRVAFSPDGRQLAAAGVSPEPRLPSSRSGTRRPAGRSSRRSARRACPSAWRSTPMGGTSSRKGRATP